jgi:hypothetical protein
MEIDYGPALREKSKHYPKHFEGRTPKTVRMLREVTPDWPIMLADPSCRGMCAEHGKEYPAHTNAHGAVSVHLPSGKRLGVKPAEFEVVEWFEADGAVTRVAPEPEAPRWTGGPMSQDRAIEINRGIQKATMARLVDGKHIPLPKCSLEEMCVATRIAEGLREEGHAVGMTTDPRGIAAMYAFEQFGSDPRALLDALGFRITNGAGSEEEDD